MKVEMKSLLNRVVVRVPGSTANLGPGYDVLGMGLDLWIEVDARISEKFSLIVYGCGSIEIPKSEDNLLVQCTRKAFDAAGIRMPPMSFVVRNQIPYGCGCGSSSSAVVAGLLVGFAMTRRRHSVDDLMQLATEIEGHPDNASAAVYGGIRIGMLVNSTFKTIPVCTPDVDIVMFIPAKKMKPHTHEMRKLVPTSVSIHDAAHNMSRTALIVNSFASGQLHHLRHCIDEKFHQNQREVVYPHMKSVISAAMGAGACFAFLSGAGPAICAFVERSCSPEGGEKTPTCASVGRAMVLAALRSGVAGDAIQTAPSNTGAQLVFSEPATDFKLNYIFTCSKL